MVMLNNNQQKIVDWLDGSLIVSAGPGSGKTRVIVERIFELVTKKNISPDKILATTFTKKAAEEMYNRLCDKGLDISKDTIRTLHSLSLCIIKSHPNYFYHEVDYKDIGRYIIKDIIGYKDLNWSECTYTEAKSFISLCRNNLVEPSLAYTMLNYPYIDKRFVKLYVKYSKEMDNRGLLSFDDMLYYAVKILEDKKNFNLLNEIQSKYTYVIIDEFQDSNLAQIKLGDLIAQPNYNYMVVGDCDQAIYEWRGALPKYMVEFEKLYNAKLITLDINYRSTPEIVLSALSCINNNEIRIEKKLKSIKTNSIPIKFNLYENSDDESENISNTILELKENGLDYNDIYVLIRMNSQSRSIEDSFIKNKIPYSIIGSISFYERKEINTLLSYLRFAYDNTDINSFKNIINTPFRYINRKIINELSSELLQEQNISAIENYIEEYHLPRGTYKSLNSFYELIYEIDINNNPGKELEKIINDTDFIEHLNKDYEEESSNCNLSNNISELVSSSLRFKDTKSFLKYVDKQIKIKKSATMNKKKNRVQVMTIHKSKGTEAECVFIIGANEDVLPHVKSNVEEERRLWYVAMTRSKNLLYVSSVMKLSHAKTHYCDCEISRFVKESNIL